MKKITVLIWGLFLLLFQISFSEEIITDSTEVNQEDVESKGIDLILIGGGGIAFFGSYHGYFNNSPAINIGLEIPFTKSHNSSFELSAHSWIARINSKYENNDFVNRNYIEISQNIYSQIGIFGVFKFYILSPKNSMARFYLQFGLGGGSKDYGGWVIGTGINYKLNENLRLQLDYRILFGVPSFAGGTKITTPNVLMLNVCYNFKW